MEIDWRIEVTDVAEQDLKRIGEPAKSRLLEKLQWFKDSFDQVKHDPLRGKWKNFFKFRVGDWRVVYEVL
ncbi:MAG: type II toxin-antitoxin system RelE/ParE family toxin [Candidatus Harrisonbacteria bacterium]|nr:type II toxin-antitoxin system RelE/ParE family toxin [Candidatus Harrisonbacteria bacterium]